MAVETQSVFKLPEQFDKLQFSECTSSNAMSTPPSQPATRCPSQPVRLKYIADNDANNVILFLRKFFFQDEPLNIDVKLLETEPTCKELEEYSLKSIKDGVSVMAVKESGDIAGVCLNGIAERNEPVEEEEEECQNPKFAKILSLLEHVEKEVDLFGKFPDVDKMMVVKIISVDTNCRGQGIAKLLCDRSANIAKEQGCSLIRTDCTSAISAIVMEKMGYECVYRLKYEDYQKNGVPVFTPEFPHEEVKVYVKRLL